MYYVKEKTCRECCLFTIFIEGKIISLDVVEVAQTFGWIDCCEVSRFSCCCLNNVCGWESCKWHIGALLVSGIDE